MNTYDLDEIETIFGPPELPTDNHQQREEMLKEYKEDEGLTLEELAAEYGVAKQTIQNWISSKRRKASNANAARYQKANPEKYRAYLAQYYRDNPEKWSYECNRESIRRTQARPVARARVVIRRAVHRLVKFGLNRPDSHTIAACELVGCSPDELVAHLEGQFKPGMTWDNHGRHGWHIDHIIPLAAADVSDPEQVALVAHYTNLQPLWAKENLSKGSKF